MMWFASATNLHPWFPKCHSWHTSGGNNDSTVSSVSMPAILRPLPAKCAIARVVLQSNENCHSQSFQPKKVGISPGCCYVASFLCQTTPSRRYCRAKKGALTSPRIDQHSTTQRGSLTRLAWRLDRGLIPGLPTLVEQLALERELAAMWAYKKNGALDNRWICKSKQIQKSESH